MRLRARLVGPLGATAIDVSGDAIRVGRDPDGEVAIDPAAHPAVSGRHARVEPAAAGGFTLVPLSQSNKTLLNGAPVAGPTPVRAGDAVRLGYTGPTLEVLALEADPPPPAGGFGETAQADAGHLAMLRGSARSERFEVGPGGVIGREAGKARYRLDHPHVSRLHASLGVTAGRVVLADLGSANGTFVNGRRVTRPVALAAGDRLDIGPFGLRFDGDALVGTSRANNVELVARDLTKAVRDRGTGRPLTILDGVTLVVRPREFVCLLGPSGSGKSTLLAALSGRAAPTSGAVLLNGRDLYAHFAALKPDIAVVPQKDVLHDTLAVGAALRYTAELRLPPDTTAAEFDASVGDVLGVVGLAERRHTPIRQLSGGQLKRASLANELLARPSLLFLDEVTSGLDEETDREVMGLFRLVADGGKTVVCITHNLTSVEATADLVVVLTAGGKLAFVGPPAGAKAYFRVARLGDVYKALAARPADAWRAEFLASPEYAEYVRDRLPPEGDEGGDDDADGESALGGDRVPAGAARQAWVLARRYAAVWRGDPAALAALLGQAVLVAALLAAVFGPLSSVADPAERAGRTVNLLFLLAVSSLWLGCNTAAKEVVKERVIFGRERAVNLRADSYLASKLAVLLAIGLGQATLLFAVVRLACAPPGGALAQWGVCVALMAAGTALGLLLSALAKTKEVAAALVPAAVIPQIVLAGVVAPLSGGTLLGAKLLVAGYWGNRALQSLLPEAERHLAGLGDPSAGWAALAVLAHAAACTLAAAAALSARREG